MYSTYMPSSGTFIPTLHLECKPNKLPLHWRGRLLLGFTFLAWSPAALALWSYFR